MLLSQIDYVYRTEAIEELRDQSINEALADGFGSRMNVEGFLDDSDVVADGVSDRSGEGSGRERIGDAHIWRLFVRHPVMAFDDTGPKLTDQVFPCPTSGSR